MKGLCLVLLNGEVAWIWQAQEETGSLAQNKLNLVRFYFVLLNDFVEETKISLVSAYPVCIVFTACSFLSSPPPLTRKKRCYFGLSHRCGMHGGTTQGSKQNKVHHNSSSCTANLPV